MRSAKYMHVHLKKRYIYWHSTYLKITKLNSMLLHSIHMTINVKRARGLL